MKNLLLIVLSVVFVSLITVLYFNQQSQISSLKNQLSTLTPTSAPVISPAPSDSTTTWQTYKNVQYGFELKYPENYVIKTNPPGKGIVTFTLNNVDKLMVMGQFPAGFPDPVAFQKDIIVEGKKGEITVFGSADNLPTTMGLVTIDLNKSADEPLWVMTMDIDKKQQAEDFTTLEKITSTIKFYN